MELPKSGSVVIIDDMINEAMPIMEALSSQGVSYCYYDGKPSNYPQKPLSNVRLIFLDMHLDEIASASHSSKNIVSGLMSGLEAILDENNGPYVILVWSKHDAQHMKEFGSALMGGSGVINKPVAILNMEKSQCLERVTNIDNSGPPIWKLRQGGADLIKDSMREQLKKVDAFEVLFNWENGIRESAKDTVREISAIFENENSEWNKNIKVYFSKMARAYAGKTLENTTSDVIRNVYYSMNDIVSDRNCAIIDKVVDTISEMHISQHEEDIIGRIELYKLIGGKNYILSTDEKKWYLYEDRIIIYENKKLNKIFEYKINDSLEVSKEIEKFYWYNIAKINSLLLLRNYVLDDCRPGNIYISPDNIKNELCNELGFNLLQRSNVVGIELEVSPICDYSQKKRKRVRILPGLLVPNSIDISDQAKYLYVSKPLLFNNQIRKLIFDFRYFTSEKENYFNNKKTLYALGDQLLQNIKEELSTHGIRSGIVFME